MEAMKIKSKGSLRFHIEMIVPCSAEINYESIQKREIIERIGYDVSISDLQEEAGQRFVFDRYAINELVQLSKKYKKVFFVISASTHKESTSNEVVSWIDSKRVKRPSLTLHYIKKRRFAPEAVTKLRHKLENGVIKLEWENPKDDGFKGVIVVKNSFRVPCSPYDGQKLYGGRDNYTYDNFGDPEVHKYYAVFSYDDVPNFSKPTFIEVNK